jgi:hypothetical protein
MPLHLEERVRTSAADIVVHRWEGSGGCGILAYFSDSGDEDFDLEAVCMRDTAL